MKNLRSARYTSITIVVAFLALAGASAPAQAGKPMGSASAPYYDAFAYPCDPWTCTSEADAENGTMTLAEARDGYNAQSYLDGQMTASFFLPESVPALMAVARIDFHDTYARVHAENGSAAAWADLEMVGTIGQCCDGGYGVFRLLDMAEGDCEVCIDEAPDALDGIQEYAIEISTSDGSPVPAGPIWIDLYLETRATAQATAPKNTHTVSVTGSLPAGQVSAFAQDPRQGVPPNVGLSVYNSTTGPITVTNEEQTPAPRPPGFNYSVSATVVEIEFRATQPQSQHVVSTPPGKLRENVTYEFTAPFDSAEEYTTCGDEARCQPTSLSEETGRFQVNIGTAFAPPVVDSGYDSARLDLFHSSFIGSAADSMVVTLVVRLDSAVAESVHQVNPGNAYVELQAVVDHRGCQTYYCRGVQTVVFAEDGTGSIWGDAPTSRGPERLEIAVPIEVYQDVVIGPGDLDIWLQVRGVAATDAYEAPFAAAGLSHAAVSLDATLEQIRVDVDPAAWPT